MRKHFFRILALSLLAASLALPLFACRAEKNPDETSSNTQADQSTVPDETEPDTELPADPIDPAAFGEPSLTYVCDDASVLSTYNNKTAGDFDGVVSYYRAQGYTVYSSADMGGNPAATLTKGSAMAHVYWHPLNGELNVVVSDTAADTLPPATPAVTDGQYDCTITQIKDSQNFIGMGYVIRLKDGSYIVYDGSYANQAAKLLKCITSNHKGGGKPIIRAWVLTHSHNDHYLAFEEIANKERFRNQIVVEHVIVAPMNEEVYMNTAGETAYLSGKFYEDAALFGAKVVFAHTGMTFKFCNLNMEVIFSPESYYKTTSEIGNFNDTSVVTRLYDDGYSALFLGDTSSAAVPIYLDAYGDYLKSDVCQMSHHGVESDYILELYDTVKPQIMFYPASAALFTSTEAQYNPQVHHALFERDYIKEILVHGFDQFVRAWGTKIDANAKLSIPGYVDTAPVIGKDISIQNGTGTRTPLPIETWLAYRVRVNGEITGFSYEIPTWTTTTADCTLSVYQWTADVATSMAAEPIASKRFEDLVDNSRNRMNFKTPLPGGEYLFVIEDVSGKVGVYCNQGGSGGVGTLYSPAGESADQPSLKIAFSAPPASPFGDGNATVSTDKTAYTEGEAIMVTANGYNRDWVGIAKKGETTPIRWWYLSPVSEGVHAPVDKAFNAVTLPANVNGDGKLPAGEYTLYLVADNGTIANGKILASKDITISAAAGQTPAVPALTPSIHLSFDDNTNDAENRVTVTANGTVTYVEGKRGHAAVLGSAYVSIPDFNPAGSFTVSFWAKISNLTGDPAIVATKDWGSGSNVGFALGISESGLHANIGDGSRRDDHKPSLADVNVNDWNHYTLVIDREAREIRVSVNFGDFTVTTIKNELVNAPYPGLGALTVGQDATGAYGYGSMTCVMDDLMVFDRALTQADLTTLGDSYAN